MAIVTEEIRVAEERRAALEAKLALAKKKFYTLGCLLQSLLEDHELERGASFELCPFSMSELFQMTSCVRSTRMRRVLIYS